MSNNHRVGPFGGGRLGYFVDDTEARHKFDVNMFDAVVYKKKKPDDFEMSRRHKEDFWVTLDNAMTRVHSVTIATEQLNQAAVWISRTIMLHILHVCKYHKHMLFSWYLSTHWCVYIDTVCSDGLEGKSHMGKTAHFRQLEEIMFSLVTSPEGRVRGAVPVQFLQPVFTSIHLFGTVPFV